MKKVSISVFLVLVVMLWGCSRQSEPEAEPAQARQGDETVASSVSSSVPEGFRSASAAGVTVRWRVEGENLAVEVSAETTGWVAVGFDPSRQMADANIIIGYADNGEAFASDDVGTGPFSHGPDVQNGGSNDLISFDATESSGVTTLSFSIPLDSGDTTDRPLESGSTYTVIVSRGPNGADNFGTQHAARGSFEIEL